MATLEARYARLPFWMQNFTTVEFFSNYAFTPTLYSWFTPAANIVEVEGAFVAGAGQLTGTATYATINLGSDLFWNDVNVSGFTAQLSTLLPGARPFWRALLSGNDTIRAPVRAEAFLVGGTFLFAELGVGDVISDFLPGTDVINLASIDANAVGGTANDAFAFIGTAAFGVNTPGQVRYGTVAGFTVIYLNTNSDAAAEASIQLPGGLAITAGNFVL